MHVMRFCSLLIFFSMNALHTEQLVEENQREKKTMRRNNESLIPVSHEQMKETSIKLAQADHPKEHAHKMHQQAAPQAQPQVSAQPVIQPIIPQQMPAASMPTMPPAQQPAQIPAPQTPPSPQNIKPVSQTAAQPMNQEQDIKGIDTVDIDEPQGNWLLKRIWWQRGQSQYEKIKALVEAIMETRMAFFAKRTEWDRKVFDPFYMEVGLGRGVLEELIASLMKRIEDERARAGDLNPEERSLLDTLESERKTLEQLQKDIQLINEIDSRIDDMITMLIQQINKARSYENQSWQNLKGIAQELSDKKARELFYTMSTHWQNANEISAFIQGQFLQSFDQLGSQAQEQIAKVKTAIQSLREKGIDLKKQWQDIENRSKVDGVKEREEQERIAQEEALRKKKEEEAKRGFFGRMWHNAIGAVNTVYGYIKKGASFIWDVTFGRFFKKSKSSEIPVEMPQAPIEHTMPTNMPATQSQE